MSVIALTKIKFFLMLGTYLTLVSFISPALVLSVELLEPLTE